MTQDISNLRWVSGGKNPHPAWYIFWQILKYCLLLHWKTSQNWPIYKTNIGCFFSSSHFLVVIHFAFLQVCLQTKCQRPGCCAETVQRRWERKSFLLPIIGVGLNAPCGSLPTWDVLWFSKNSCQLESCLIWSIPGHIVMINLFHNQSKMQNFIFRSSKHFIYPLCKCMNKNQPHFHISRDKHLTFLSCGIQLLNDSRLLNASPVRGKGVKWAWCGSQGCLHLSLGLLRQAFGIPCKLSSPIQSLRSLILRLLIHSLFVAFFLTSTSFYSSLQLRYWVISISVKGSEWHPCVSIR